MRRRRIVGNSIKAEPEVVNLLAQNPFMLGISYLEEKRRIMNEAAIYTRETQKRKNPDLRKSETPRMSCDKRSET